MHKFVYFHFSNSDTLTTSVWILSQASPSQTFGTCVLTATTSTVTMVVGQGVAQHMLTPTNILIMSITNRYNNIYGKRFCTSPVSFSVFVLLPWESTGIWKYHIYLYNFLCFLCTCFSLDVKLAIALYVSEFSSCITHNCKN